MTAPGKKPNAGPLYCRFLSVYSDLISISPLPAPYLGRHHGSRRVDAEFGRKRGDKALLELVSGSVLRRDKPENQMRCGFRVRVHGISVSSERAACLMMHCPQQRRANRVRARSLAASWIIPPTAQAQGPLQWLFGYLDKHFAFSAGIAKPLSSWPNPDC